MKLMRCGVCGYVWDGDEAPDACPKCGAPKEKFADIPKEEADLILRSRHTNDLYCRLISLMEEAGIIAEDGIKDNLDPTCLTLFKKTKEFAWIIGQASKAEVRGHMNKGKWG